MTYLCEDCGNIESFRATAIRTERVSEGVYTDGEGEEQDWGDRDIIDSETDEYEDWECQECDSSTVTWYEEPELSERMEELGFGRADTDEPVDIKNETITNWKAEITK